VAAGDVGSVVAVGGFALAVGGIGVGSPGSGGTGVLVGRAATEVAADDVDMVMGSLGPQATTGSKTIATRMIAA
jgi:hypothetical protein